MKTAIAHFEASADVREWLEYELAESEQFEIVATASTKDETRDILDQMCRGEKSIDIAVIGDVNDDHLRIIALAQEACARTITYSSFGNIITEHVPKPRTAHLLETLLKTPASS